MNFTREPIIETIITPKEGFTLVVRNSHGNSEEGYSVASVEVVSFGKSFFFRSLEKPKAFLLPVSDYEVLETREMRTVLKRPQIEKSIKIAGGKVPSKGKGKESLLEKEGVAKKQGRSKTSRRHRLAKNEPVQVNKESTITPKRDGMSEPSSPSLKRTLLPPPTSLISEQINRYKEYLTAEGTLLPEELEEGGKIEKLPKESCENFSLFPDDEGGQAEKLLQEKDPSKVQEEEKAPTFPDCEEK